MKLNMTVHYESSNPRKYCLDPAFPRYEPLEAVWKLAIYCGGARIASLRHDGGKNCVV